MKIKLNHAHILIWKKMLAYWLAFVVFGLIAGWHLKPRPDEVAFMLSLPAIVVIPYGLGCLAVATLRVLWPVGFHRWLFSQVRIDLSRNRLRNRA